MDAVGKIVVSYANGGKQLLSVGCNPERMEPKDVEGINQDSGIILGAKTQPGVDKVNKGDASWINTLEFLMLKEHMVSTELTRVKLEEDIDTWNTQAKGKHLNTLNQTRNADVYIGIERDPTSYTQYFHNDAPKGTTGKDVTYKFGGTTTKDFTQTLRFDWTNAFGFTGEIGIEQSIKTPGWLSSIAGEAEGKATAKFGGKFDHTELHSTGKEYKDSRAINWGMGSERQKGLKPLDGHGHCEISGWKHV